MICAHDFDKIKDQAIKIRRPPATSYSDDTINALEPDLLDFHLDLKKIMQQHEKKALKYRIKITQFLENPDQIYLPTFAPSDYAGADLGSGNASFSVSALDGSFVNGTITGGGLSKHWIVNSAPAGGTPVTTESGDFLQPASHFATGTVPLDQLYDVEIARPNYTAFLDIDVAKKSETPTPTNLVFEVDQFSGSGAFNDAFIRPVGVARPSRRFFGTSTTSISVETGLATIQTEAGLFYSKGLRIRATSKADGTQWVEGVITQYNDDGNDEFYSSTSQIANNLHTFGANGDLMWSKDSNIIVPAILRKFPFGDPSPDIRSDPSFRDDIDIWIHPPGFLDFDRLVGVAVGVAGAPYWGPGGYGGIWSNQDHVPSLSYGTYGGFTEMAVTSFGLKVGYLKRIITLPTIERIALTTHVIEYVP